MMTMKDLEANAADLLEQLFGDREKFTMFAELRALIRNVEPSKNNYVLAIRRLLGFRYCISFGEAVNREAIRFTVQPSQLTDAPNYATYEKTMDDFKPLTDMEVVHAKNVDIMLKLLESGKRNRYDLIMAHYPKERKPFTHGSFYVLDLLYHLCTGDKEAVCAVFRERIETDPAFICASDDASICLAYVRTVSRVRSVIISFPYMMNRFRAVSKFTNELITAYMNDVMKEPRRLLGFHVMKSIYDAINSTPEQMYPEYKTKVLSRGSGGTVISDCFFDFLHMAIKVNDVNEEMFIVLAQNLDLVVCGYRHSSRNASIFAHLLKELKMTNYTKPQHAHYRVLIDHITCLVINSWQLESLKSKFPNMNFIPYRVDYAISGTTCYICLDEFVLREGIIGCARCKDSKVHFNCVKNAGLKCGFCRVQFRKY
jgi:hypothetical protein